MSASSKDSLNDGDPFAFADIVAVGGIIVIWQRDRRFLRCRRFRRRRFCGNKFVFRDVVELRGDWVG